VKTDIITEELNTKANIEHHHSINDVSNLQSLLDGLSEKTYIKNTASGEIITLTDTSPLEHNIDVKLNYNKLSPNSSIETLLQISEAGSAILIFDGEATSGRYVVQ
jgi:hypothetical protein